MKKFYAILLALFASSGLLAQEKGVVKVFNSPLKQRVMSLSDNGLFAVGYAIDVEGFSTAPFLWDLQKDTQINLPDSEGNDVEVVRGEANDVVDDGTLIVGACNDLPATYDTTTKKWTMLPMPSKEYVSGWASKVTPDGKYIIGIAFTADMKTGEACLWENGKLLEVVLPEKTIFGGAATMNCFDAISADGSIVTGRLQYTKSPQASCAFVYNIHTKEFRYMAPDIFLEKDPGGEILHNEVLDNAVSPNGKYVGGVFYGTNYIGDPEDYSWLDVEEYSTCFTYEPRSGKFVDMHDVSAIYTEVGISTVDNNGIYYAFTPINYPVRTAYIIQGENKTPLVEYVRKNFNADISGKGTVMSVSANGDVLAVLETLFGDNYVVAKAGALTGTATINTPTVRYSLEGKELHLAEEVRSVALYDLSGRRLLKMAHPQSVITLACCQGTYILKIVDNKGEETMAKIILP